MKTFEEFIQESPRPIANTNMGFDDAKKLDDIIYLSKNEGKPIDFKCGNIPMTAFKHGDLIYFSVIEDDTLLFCSILKQTSSRVLTQKSIWRNDQQDITKRFSHKFLLDYVCKHFILQSDTQQTRYGNKLWVELCKLSKQKGYNVYTYDGIDKTLTRIYTQTGITDNYRDGKSNTTYLISDKEITIKDIRQ